MKIKTKEINKIKRKTPNANKEFEKISNDLKNKQKEIMSIQEQIDGINKDILDIKEKNKKNYFKIFINTELNDEINYCTKDEIEFVQEAFDKKVNENEPNRNKKEKCFMKDRVYPFRSLDNLDSDWAKKIFNNVQYDEYVIKYSFVNDRDKTMDNKINC